MAFTIGKREHEKMKNDTSTRLSNQERWDAFIAELRAYIEELHLGPSKHTTLRNQVVYFRRKMRDGLLSAEKAEELERVLGMRDLSIHTGGRRKSSHDPCAGASLWDSLSVATGLKPSSTGSGQV